MGLKTWSAMVLGAVLTAACGGGSKGTQDVGTNANGTGGTSSRVFHARAIDGYLAVAAAWMLWRLVGWLLDRPALQAFLWPDRSAAAAPGAQRSFSSFRNARILSGLEPTIGSSP